MENRSLSSCLELVIDRRGVTPKKLNTDWKKEGIRVLSAKNIKSTGIINENEIRYVDRETYKKWMKNEIEKNDILLTSEAPAGEVYLWDSDEKICVGQRLYCLRTKKDVYPRYLKYYLQSPSGQREILKYNSGSTVFGISAKTFNHINVFLPDYETQVKIGDFLYYIDKKIETNKNILRLSNDLVEKIFNYWFVSFGHDSIRTRTYNESLGIEIPIGWNVDILEKYINFEKGISYSSDELNNSKKDSIPMINLASIDVNRNYNPNSLKYFKGTKKNLRKVCPGEMLIACTDLTRNAHIIGSPIIVPSTSKEFTYSMDLVKLNIDENVFDKYFMYMLLRTNNYHKYIKGFASGTNVIHLNTDGIKWYKTIIPPLEIQQRFSKYIKDNVDISSQIINENNTLSKERDYLLPLLINGQIKLEDKIC